jgi:nucleoside 2-deoxyribosyltransferase
MENLVNKRIYIAGPFFNDAQVDRIKFIEQCCERYGIIYFSPRIHAEPLVPTSDGITNVFLSDLDGIESSTLVFACLDWLLPENHILGECQVSKNCYSSDGKQWSEYSPVDPEHPDANIADPGTCMEIGFTYALMRHSVSRFLIGHLTKPTPLANLMLTEACSAILPSEEMIDMFLRDWASVQNNTDAIKLIDEYSQYQWQGTVQ